MPHARLAGLGDRRVLRRLARPVDYEALDERRSTSSSSLAPESDSAVQLKALASSHACSRDRT